MTTAIQIELDALFFLILFVIAYQSIKNVNQQMSRVLFRWTTYGIMCSLVMDIIWLLVDGVKMPGMYFLNKFVNAIFLSFGILLGCVWYMYVLETLGYKITRKLALLVLTPAFIFTALNLASMKTGWIFGVTKENVYFRGPLFWLQTTAALAVLFVSFFHILIRLVNGNTQTPRKEVVKLLRFYIIPVIGTLLSIPFTGMPGTWTCAAVSIILIYLDAQDEEVVRDSLTGLNNRKMLGPVFADFVKQETPDARLFLFMMDLDDFKKINDSLGHPIGDQALMIASKLFIRAVDGKKAMVARVGGDEFLILGFFRDIGEAGVFAQNLLDSFAEYSAREKLPFLLSASIGYRAHQPGQTLDEFIASADEALYQVKRMKKMR